MGRDSALHFDGRDILTAADDDVLFAVDDVDVVLLVPNRHVAGVQPLAAHYGGGSLRLVKVPIHDVVAAYDDFADALHVARNVIQLEVDNPYLAAGKGPAGH